MSIWSMFQTPLLGSAEKKLSAKMHALHSPNVEHSRRGGIALGFQVACSRRDVQVFGVAIGIGTFPLGNPSPKTNPKP